MRHRIPVLFAAALFTLAAFRLHAADAPAPAPASTPAPATPAADTAPAAKVETYKVNLSPPVKVGQKFTLSSDVANNQHIKVIISGTAMPTPQTQEQSLNVTAHLDAEGEAVEVFPNGSLKKISLTIGNLSATQDGKPVDGLPAAGAKIVIEKDDTNKETITIDDKPAATLPMRMLSSLAEMGRAKYLDQEAFGPSEPVAVGGAWTVNSDVIKQSSPQFDDSSIINGTMKLDKVTGSGDDQVLAVSGTFSALNFKMQLPSPLEVKSASMESKMSSSIPATTTKGVYMFTTSTNLTSDGAATSPDGGTEIKATLEGGGKHVTQLTFH